MKFTEDDKIIGNNKLIEKWIEQRNKEKVIINWIILLRLSELSL